MNQMPQSLPSGIPPNIPQPLGQGQYGISPNMMMNINQGIPRGIPQSNPRVSSSPSIMNTSGSIQGSPIAIPVQPTPQLAKPITPQLHSSTPDKHVISREKLQELVQMFDSTERLDTEAEDLLLLVADEFVDSVTEFACKLAKHRKSNTLEARDLELHLEKAWNIKIPGFCTSTPSADANPVRRPNLMTASHQQRLMDIKKTKK